MEIEEAPVTGASLLERLAAAANGHDLAGTVISAVHGFAGPGGVSPATVDRAGNADLIAATARTGAAFVLVSVVGASPGHPIGLFRAKHAAEARCAPAASRGPSSGPRPSWRPGARSWAGRCRPPGRP